MRGGGEYNLASVICLDQNKYIPYLRYLGMHFGKAGLDLNPSSVNESVSTEFISNGTMRLSVPMSDQQTGVPST